MKIVAIITARGGSKRLPGKNLRPLAGIPLIAHTIRAARGSKYISAIHVTTDDSAIADASLAEGAQVIKRPAEFAQDASSSEDALRHALGEISRLHGMPDAFCLLQPTSPLRESRHIDAALDAFIAAGGEPMISVKRAPLHLNKLLRMDNQRLVPFFDESIFKDRGSLTDLFQPNGAIYAVKADYFLATGNLYSDRIVPFVMDDESSIDIDTLADLRQAEIVLSAR